MMAGGVCASHKHCFGSIRMREWIIEYPRRGPREKQDVIPSSMHRIDSSESGANAWENLNRIRIRSCCHLLCLFKHHFILFPSDFVHIKPHRHLVFLCPNDPLNGVSKGKRPTHTLSIVHSHLTVVCIDRKLPLQSPL